MNTREQLSKAKQRVGLLIIERSRVEKLLLKSGPLLEGSLFVQYRKCGKSGCRCERGKRHGPYPYLVVGKGVSRRLTYVAAKDYVKAQKRSKSSKDFAESFLRLTKLNADITALLKEIKEILANT